jgi:hypothetical protein
VSSIAICYLTGRTRSCQFRPGASPKRPIRLRQHGTVVSFSQKNSQREFFCEKDQVSSALPEGLFNTKRGTV